MSGRNDAAGRVLMVGLPGPELDAALRARLRRLAPGGVILFARNLETPAHCRSLVEELRRTVDHPLLLAVDQEGGRVSRLGRWIGTTPSAAALTRAGPEVTRRFAVATGRALRATGFNLDFAPVVDLGGAGAANGIGDRSFGDDPLQVTRLAGAFLDGLQEQGIAGCLKHFPGLGPTSVDSHETLPIAERTCEELLVRDLLPFRRLASRSPAVMVGHAHYPALDPAPGVPASLSAPIVSGLLRSRLGYRGLVASDDLEMGAIGPLDMQREAGARAIAAGCDLILYCAQLELAEQARRAIERAAEVRREFDDRLRQAAATVADFAGRWVAPSTPALAWDQARLDLESFADLA